MYYIYFWSDINFFCSLNDLIIQCLAKVSEKRTHMLLTEYQTHLVCNPILGLVKSRVRRQVLASLRIHTKEVAQYPGLISLGGNTFKPRMRPISHCQNSFFFTSSTFKVTRIRSFLCLNKKKS